MKIVIQRHGEPDIGEWGKISSTEMTKWINCYNESGVVIDNHPCSKSLAHAKNSFVVCSTLERSRHSVELLKADKYIADSSFCEAELPVVNFPLLKISPHAWSIVFRVFWFLGLSNDVESKKEIIARVKVATKMLENFAEEHENVLLVGHGIMNRLIGRELIQRRWHGEEAPNGKKYHGYSYWEYSVFTK
ncbi:MAG: histidine phosphatase family protein [Gammaproteobacteria bacterium]|nr:histidine phosphatase family protein [Gammaproteobacteria bacterium]